MRNSFKKMAAVAILVFPFLWLTLSFCCIEMGSTNTHSMAMAASMATGDTVQKGLSFNGGPCQSSQFQCEKLTEKSDNVKISGDSPQAAFLNSHSILSSEVSFPADLIQSASLNYESPPKLVLNSLPLYLQISVLRL